MLLHGIAEQQTQLETANGATLALAMIETRAAIAALDAILAVEGIDGVFVGPSDLSVTLTDGKKIVPLDPMLDAPLREIADKTRAAGKIAGVFAANPERGRFFQTLGYTLIAVGSDLVYLTNGAKAMVTALTGKA
jgi:4-hydroxy-2-oxoheptanedioate aldolase